MTQAKMGDTVKVHYTGTLKNGDQFDSSAGREPLSFTLGQGQVIPGFENAIVGMRIGDSKTVTIPAEEAYGPHHAEAIKTFPRSAIPEHIELEVGLQLQASGPDGQMVLLTVIEVNDEIVQLDANHPLAGKDLTFALELVAVA